MRRLVALMLIAGMGACDGEGDPGDCSEALPDTAACCDPELYAQVALTSLALEPGRYVGARVETAGIADWLIEGAVGSDCICAGGTCTCVTPLGLRSRACPSSFIQLGGDYRGRPVECASEGCWPLVLLQRYAACGRWTWDGQDWRLGGRLALESFCER